MGRMPGVVRSTGERNEAKHHRLISLSGITVKVALSGK